MITQEVNPYASILGFVWNWITEISKHVENLYVTAYDVVEPEKLPKNVHCSHFSYAIIPKTWTEIAYLKLFKELDVVFAHMCPTFVISVTPICKLLGIPIVLWYSHKHVDLKLKLACALSKKVFTAYEGGCSVAGDKLEVIGHGIYVSETKEALKKGNEIVSVGRVSRVKEFEIVISAMPQILQYNKNMVLKIVGDIYDREYFNELKALAKKLNVENNVEFLGEVPFSDIRIIYATAMVMVDTNRHGVSKTSLEAMHCGTPTMVRSASFKNILAHYFKNCYYAAPEELAEKVTVLLKNRKLNERISHYVERVVKANFGLQTTIKKLVTNLEKARRKIN